MKFLEILVIAILKNLIEGQTLNGNNQINFVYQVQPGDNLFSIAQRFCGSPLRFIDIQLLNNIRTNILIPGTSLRLPADCSMNRGSLVQQLISQLQQQQQKEVIDQQQISQRSLINSLISQQPIIPNTLFG